MKKLSILLLILSLAASCALADSAVYQETVDGFGGPMTVEVTLNGETIERVEVTANTETSGIGTNAVEQLPGRIVAQQSVAVDAVAGCTISSGAILKAVTDALTEAGLDPQNYMASSEKKASGETIELSCDVVVVGAGAAGLAAASKAREDGASVILLEKTGFTGGNSALSTGILHLGHTDIQAAAGIEDSVEAFEAFAMAKSGGHRDPVQVHMIGAWGNDAANWLVQAGVTLSDKVSLITGGDSIPRGHQALPNAAAMAKGMTEHAESIGVDLRLNTAATELVTEDGAVVGVTAKDADGNTLSIRAKKTILAAGGFAADPAMMTKYWGMDNIGYTGAPGATGEMLEACLALGADTVDIDIPWLTPTVEKDRNVLVTAMMLANGAILVDSHGNRFCDEEASYAEASAAVQATGEPYVNEIFDAHVAEAVNYKFPDYYAMGIVVEADTLEELAEKLEIPADALTASVDAYNAAVRGENADPFGRTIVLEECNQAPFYAIRVRPGTVMSPGGLRINERCEVVTKDGDVIPNVYATGEMTGGYRAYGYIGGDSLAHAVITGLVAGTEAAK